MTLGMLKDIIVVVAHRESDDENAFTVATRTIQAPKMAFDRIMALRK
jgi:hypothetical protein